MGIPDVSPEVTNIEIQEFAIEHFPEGPAAAIEPQKSMACLQAECGGGEGGIAVKKAAFLSIEATDARSGETMGCSRRGLVQA